MQEAPLYVLRSTGHPDRRGRVLGTRGCGSVLKVRDLDNTLYGKRTVTDSQDHTQSEL